MRDFSKLFIWQKSHKLVMSIYDITNKFPKSEIYGLTSQIRRASSSIPINISEGCGRSSNKDFARFLQIAIGSACEVEYELLLAKDLKYIEVLEKRTGLKVACLEEIAYTQGWITKEKIIELAQPMIKNQYGQYLLRVAQGNEL